MTTQHHRTLDTVVVGGGLAGLARALDLCRAWQRVALLEASDGVGGRMRTDRRDGFLLDRGFRVFNTSCSQVKRRLDLPSLRLGPFAPGIIARLSTGPVCLADPTRRPEKAGALLPGRVLPARVLAAMAALIVRDVVLPAGGCNRRPDRSTADALSRAGLSAEVVTEILLPFLSGVFLENRLETSARFFHLVLRSMVRGTLCLPADGIGAVPAQPAGGLPDGVLRPETVGRATEVGDEVAEYLMAVNVLAPAAFFRAALGIMRPGSVIAAFTGVVTERPQAGMADYSASKAALSAWLGAARREARTAGIRVLDIRPGHPDTRFADRPVAGTSPPMPAGGDPHQLVGAVVDAMEAEAELLRATPDGTPVVDRRAR